MQTKIRDHRQVFFFITKYLRSSKNLSDHNILLINGQIDDLRGSIHLNINITKIFILYFFKQYILRTHKILVELIVKLLFYYKKKCCTFFVFHMINTFINCHGNKKTKKKNYYILIMSPQSFTITLLDYTFLKNKKMQNYVCVTPVVCLWML